MIFETFYVTIFVVKSISFLLLLLRLICSNLRSYFVSILQNISILEAVSWILDTRWYTSMIILQSAVNKTTFEVLHNAGLPSRPCSYCSICTFVGTQKLGHTYGYVCCWPLCDRISPRPRRNVPMFRTPTGTSCPGDGTGSPGWPYSSTRTLTTGQGGKVPSPTALYGTGETRGGNSPPPDVVIVAEEGTPTRVSCATDEFSCSLTLPWPKDVARDFVLGPLTLGRGLSYIPKPIPNRLGCERQNVCECHARSRSMRTTYHYRPMAGLQLASEAHARLSYTLMKDTI